MKKYKVEISRSAEKVLFRLPKQIIPKIIAAVQALAANPYPSGCRKLAGHENILRIRVNVYRIIYEIHDDLVLVRVLKIGHRKDIYRHS